MTDRLELENKQDAELKRQLDKIDWRKYIWYGNVKIQIRDGERKLTAIERTYPD